MRRLTRQLQPNPIAITPHALCTSKKLLTHEALIMFCIRILQANNHPVDTRLGGLCYGTSIAAAQLNLIDGLDEFNAIIKTLDQVKTNAISRKPIEFSEVESDEQIVAFFKMLHAYQKMQQPPKPEHQFLALDEKGGFTCAQKFAGVYSKDSLTQTLKLLRSAFLRYDQPVSIVIRDMGHAVNVNYNPKTDQWFFYDTNTLPMQCFQSDEALAEALKNGLSGDNGNITLATEIFTAGNHAAQLKTQLDEVYIQQAWLDIHQPTKTNALLTNKDGYSKLHAASRVGDIETMKLLINQFGADVNATDNRGRPALYYAIKSTSLDAVSVVIDAGANVPADAIVLAEQLAQPAIVALLQTTHKKQSALPAKTETPKQTGMLSSMFRSAKNTRAYDFYKEHLEFHPFR